MRAPLRAGGGMWSLEWAMANNAALRSVVVIDSGVLLSYFGHPLGVAYATPNVGELTMATTTRSNFKATIEGQNPEPLPESFLDRTTRCAVLPYYRAIADRCEADPGADRRARCED